MTNPNLIIDPDTQFVSVEDSSPTISVIWDRVAQTAVVETSPGPTIASRSYAMVHTAIYDAWSAYEDTPISTNLEDELQRPQSENTIDNKSEAMSYAAYHVLVALFPEHQAIFDEAMEDLGYDPDLISTDTATPAGIGYISAQALLNARQNDGSNQLGDDSNGNGTNYSDITDYQPSNNIDGNVDLESWTPERVPIDDPNGPIQQFLTPHWGNVTPFALESGSQFRPTAPQPFLLVDGEVDLEAKTITLEDGSVLDITPDLVGTVINPEFIAQAEEVIQYSGNLTDEQKLIAEFWEDGGGTSFPPGTWMTFGQYVSARDDNTLDEDVQMFFTLGNAVFDAGIATWEAKTFYDYARPVRVVRELGELGLIGEFDVDIGGHTVEVWHPDIGIQTILASEFLTYQTPGSDPSPPFAEYTSGHSAFSAAGAEVLQLFTGSDDFGGNITINPGESRFEPGITPDEPITLTWDTFSEAADEAGISRLYGGIHFRNADINGRQLGREVGNIVFAQSQFYINGGVAAASSLNFDEISLAAGSIVNSQFAGVTIDSDDSLVMIFDTANPTGEDTDLASDTLGNVLILSEDGDSNDPDDNAEGGTFDFAWDNPVNLNSVGFLDVEETGGNITLYDRDLSVIGSFDIPNTTHDGGTSQLDIGLNDVSYMELSLVGSGAITEVNFS